MAHIRWSGIPIDHLVSEVASFPLASEAALRLGIIELNPWLTGIRSEDSPLTSKLWREAERLLTAHAPNVSLDELVAIRDRTWFREASQEEVFRQPLHQYLKTLAGRHLRVRGRIAVPCLQFDHWHDGLDADALSKLRSREAWRWLTFALPPDMLLAAMYGPGGIPTRVETLSPQFDETLLRRGFSETHLHVGAGMEFSLLWTSTMCGLASEQLSRSSFASPGAELQEGRELAGWLLRAAIVRFFLASFLKERLIAVEASKSFDEFFRRHRGDLLNEFGKPLLDVVQDAMCDLDTGTFSSPSKYEDLRDAYARLIAGCHQSFPKRPYPIGPFQVLPEQRPQIHMAQAADPIAVSFEQDGDESPTPEMQFFAAGLQYAEWTWTQEKSSSGTLDIEFLKLYWQVARVRCLFYRHVVQRPMTPGLQWFIRTYSRLSPGRKSIGTGLQVESAAWTSGLGRGLRSLELRTCPEDSVSTLLEFVDDADQQFRWLNGDQKPASPERGALTSVGDCEMGIIFHFAKDRGGGARQGTPNGFWIGSHADPSAARDVRHGQTSVPNPTGYRYASYYQMSVRTPAQSVAGLLLGFPLSLAIVRGIDVCTDELGVPTWVMAPAFRYLRDVSNHVSSWLYSVQTLKVPPLRTTVHAGEDFVHLMTGLRNVSWAMNYLGLREGDRIGHGIALGVNATEWAKSAGRIAVMREERLFDLLFEWHCYSAEHVAIAENRRAFLDREIARLSQQVFGQTVPPYELETLVELLHDENALKWIGFPDGQRRPVSALVRSVEFQDSIRPALCLLKEFLTSPDVFHRGRVLEWLDPVSEAEVLERLQEFLRSQVGIQGLAIEANVSSNLLISNLGSLENHPLFRLSPPHSSSELQSLPVVFGSDDPITFASNLPNEYALVRDALVRGAGLSDIEANSWLDRVRENSLAYRFTIPRPPFESIRDIVQTCDANSIANLL